MVSNQGTPAKDGFEKTLKVSIDCPKRKKKAARGRGKKKQPAAECTVNVEKDNVVGMVEVQTGNEFCAEIPLSTASSDVDVAELVKQQVSLQMGGFKAYVGELMQETTFKFEETIAHFTTEVVTSLVAEVGKLLKTSKDVSIAKENVIYEVDSSKLLNIESEGGNDARFVVPLQGSPSGANQSKLPETPRSEDKQFEHVSSPNRTTTALSDWSRSPTEPMGIMRNQMDQDGNKTIDAPFAVRKLFFSEVLFPQTIGTPTLPKKAKNFLEAGLFSVRSSISEQDELIMKYIFCGRPITDAAKRVEVARYGDWALNRQHFQSLEPRQLICDDIINMVAHYMSQPDSSSWYLPTYFGQRAKDFKERKICRILYSKDTGILCKLDRFSDRIAKCKKIFIPLHDWPSSTHWFLLVVDILQKKAELFDSYPNKKDPTRRNGFAQSVLKHLDHVFGLDWLVSVEQYNQFASFEIVSPVSNPHQRNGYDCGAYVIGHMLNYGENWFDKFNSVQNRIQLSLKIAKNPRNELLQTLNQLHRGRSTHKKVNGEGLSDKTTSDGSSWENLMSFEAGKTKHFDGRG